MNLHGCSRSRKLHPGERDPSARNRYFMQGYLPGFEPEHADRRRQTRNTHACDRENPDHPRHAGRRL
jgi:hypothetical protein